MAFKCVTNKQHEDAKCSDVRVKTFHTGPNMTQTNSRKHLDWIGFRSTLFLKPRVETEFKHVSLRLFHK